MPVRATPTIRIRYKGVAQDVPGGTAKGFMRSCVQELGREPVSGDVVAGITIISVTPKPVTWAGRAGKKKRIKAYGT